MKSTYYFKAKISRLLLVSTAFMAKNLLAQTTVTMQNSPTTGMDIRICSVTGYTTSTGTEVMASAWTYQGTAGTDHSFLSFDMSVLPSNCVIEDAQLFLYGASDLPSGAHSAMSGSNQGLVQRVTSSWGAASTWATQPTTTSVNQVTIPASSTSTQNYQLDVTDMVQDMVDSQQVSYGFALKLQTETYYRRLNFASRNYADAAKRPKLVVTYTSTAGIAEEAESMVSVYPNPTGTGGIHVQLKDGSNTRAEIYSMLGEKVYSGEIQGANFYLDLKFLKKGMYQLRLSNDSKTIAKRLEVL